MKKILSLIVAISSLLLIVYGSLSKSSDTLHIQTTAPTKTTACHYSSTDSATDFHAILAANSVQCPPINSINLSETQLFATTFPPYSVLNRHANGLEKTQWTICSDIKFVPNDIIQAHYSIFALRRILI